MTLLIIYLLIALLVSFFCSIAEAVLLSVRPAFVNARLKQNARGAHSLEQLINNLDRPLAAILTLNTVAHTVGAVGVGAQATLVFGNEYVGLSSALLTLLILVFSEIIPKTLGAAYWPVLAGWLGPVIAWLTWLLSPFVWLSQKLTQLIARDGSSAFNFSRDEFEAMAEIGAEEGHIDAQELEIVSNLMRLRLLTVSDIMTPRTVMFLAAADMRVDEYFSENAKKPFSRIPVYEDHRDDITGYVLRNDLFAAQAKDQFDRRLSEFKRTCLAVPEQLSASDLFEQLLRERTHIAFVVDEYGSVQGLVTQEDVMETLFGLEITDESDTVEDMRALARKRWRERMQTFGVSPDNLK